MGKKIHSNADRERIQQAAAERRHAKEVKQMIILVIAVLCVIAIVAISIPLKDVITRPAEIRDLSAIEDNWVVIDTDNKVSKRYHHPASFDLPEGYVLDDFNTANDKYLRSFLATAEAEEPVVESIHVSAASDWSASQYIQNVQSMNATTLNEGTTVEVGEPFTATIAGKEAQCLYLCYTTTTETETTAYGSLFVGFDAPKNVCVYAVLSGAYTAPENVQTAEVLLSEAETLLAGLTIVK